MSERLRIAVLSGLAILVYANTLFNGFTYDDYPYILQNPTVTSLSFHGLFQPANADPRLRFFRPVTFATYDLNWAVAQDRPFGYHLLNLLLHALVAVLLYKLLRRLLERVPQGTTISWIAALLFAVHPIHTEAVAYVVGRSELLAATLVLLAWICHLEDRSVLALASFALALLSKESAIAFVPLVVIGDYVRGQMKPVGRYAAVAAVAGLYVGLLWTVQGQRFSEEIILFLNNPLAGLPAGLRILNATRIAWKYLGLQVAPVSLSCDYSYAAIPLYAAWRHLAPGAIAAALLLAVWGWSARWAGKEWFLAGAIYFAGFATTANILLPAGTIMGERLCYLPSAGFCLAIALLLVRIGGKWPQASWVVAALVVVVLSVRTMARNQDWHDNATLFSAALRVVPQDAKMLDAMGGEYMKHGRADLAQPLLAEAIRIYPDFPDSLRARGVTEYDFRLVNLADELSRLGETDDALVFVNMAIAKSPRFSVAWSTRAAIEYRRGETDSAVSDARTAMQLDPSNSQAQRLLGAPER